MTMPTDEQQEEILSWWEGKGRRLGTTDRIAKGVLQALQAVGLSDAKEVIIKVALLAEKIDNRQEKIALAERRAKAAASSAYQMDVAERKQI